jgi:sulfate adenylyltransferase
MVQCAEQRRELEARCTHTQVLSDRNACDVELLTVGGFSPLTGFMNRTTYEHVIDNMR